MVGITSRSSDRTAQTLVSNPADDGRSCCLCGADSFELVHQWESAHPRNSASIPLSVWQCQCGLVLLHPLPAEYQLPACGEWWSAHRKLIVRRTTFKKVRKTLQDFLFNDARQRLILQTKKLIPSGRLLDIGCGMGQLLDKAKQYYECVGVELSPKGTAATRSRGFEVLEGRFEDVQLPAGAFDVATMDAVLEHVVDPVAVLQKVNGALRPGGVVAIKVPKLWGPSHRLHGREWNGFRVGYHTVMFTGATLARALQAAGFEVCNSPQRDRPLDDILVLWGRKVREVVA